MLINVIGRQLEITPAIKTYTETRLQAFDLFTSLKITGINATMDYSKGHFQVNLVLNCKYHTLTANTEDFDLYKAFDAAADKLESQCAVLKEKIQEHRAEPVSQTDIKQQEA
jgi:putative sigma-54 modulation protein